MQRETTIFKTSKGNTVEYKSYLTGLEARTIEGVYLSIAKIGMEGGEPTFKDVNTSAIFEAEKLLVKTAVVKYNGSEDVEKNLADLLNLPIDEYEEVVAELNKLSKKKTS